MRWRLGDILACPECSYSPLNIKPLSIVHLPPGNNAFIHNCTNYCMRLNKVISETVERQELPCKECREEEIEEGVISCPHCRRWYALMQGIPHLVRDGLRLVAEERDFLKRHQAHLQAEIWEAGIPLNLKSCSIKSSAEDEIILEEGRYWSDFFKAYYSAGDTSILDIRSRGKHPPFLNYGVRETDDLEHRRRWGPWPRKLGKMLFTPLKQVQGKRGLDLGCGGGQFGLEAAYQGIDMTGCDISPGALLLAKEYARSVGLDNQYVYADAQNLPFRRQVFSLLMSKDALHHLADPETAIRKAKTLLFPDALVIICEHIGNSTFSRIIYDFFARRLIPKIERRYPRVAIPEVLLKGAPREDLGMAKVKEVVLNNFYIVKKRYEWMLYLKLEQLFHFAFGKRRLISYPVMIFTYMFERICLTFFRPDFLIVIGRYRG